MTTFHTWIALNRDRTARLNHTHTATIFRIVDDKHFKEISEEELESEDEAMIVDDWVF
jgi:hypothetical protein